MSSALAAASMGVRGPEQISFPRLDSARPFPGPSGPVSPTVVPYPASIAYVPDASDCCLGLCRDRRQGPVILVLGHQRPSRARHVVGERTATSMRGLRASTRSRHEPAGAPRTIACLTTVLPPMMSSRRIVRSPIFENARGSACRWSSAEEVQGRARPRSRGPWKVSGGGASATIAVAAIDPMPGMVINRRAPSSSQARRAVSL